MVRLVSRFLLMLALMFGMTAMMGVAAAQDAVPAHPSHIHEGTCDDLNPQPAYPLNDVTSVSPDAPAGAVEVGHSTIDVTLDELLASPYALNVHESGENVATYIACGNVAGPVVDGLLLIPLREQSDSSYYGIAALAGNDAGGTDVSVYIAPDAMGAMLATPVAEVAAPTEPAGETGAAEPGEVDAPMEVAVDIVDFTFSPQVLEVPVGTTVTWTNSDTSQHTATANDGTFDSGVLAQGDSFSFTFETAGTFDYFCEVHPNMTAQIVVTG